MRLIVSKLFLLIQIVGVRSKIGFLIALTIVGALLEALGVGAALPALKLIVEPEGAIESYLPAEYSFLANEKALIPALAGLLFLIFVAKNAYLAFLVHYQARFVWGHYTNTAARLLEYYMARDYEFHLQHNSAALITNINISLRQIFVTSIFSLVMMASELLVILSISITLLVLQPVATIVVAGLLCTTGVLYYLALRSRISIWGKRALAHFENGLLWLNHSLGAVKELTVIGRSPYFVEKFREHNSASARYSRSITVANQMPRYLLETTAIGALMAVVAIFHGLGMPLQPHLPMLGIFVVAGLRLMPSIGRIAMYVGNLRYGEGALDRVFDEIRTAMSSSGTCLVSPVTPIKLLREITVDDVSFAYSGSPAPVLRNVSLTITKGEAVAFVGASGAGKTTLADLLLGLLKPKAGAILVDGCPIESDLAGWRSCIGYIPQEVFLIDDTIRRNIALGVRDTEIDEEQLKVALRKSHLDEAVARMPNGLDTMIGERGTRLSGGQRQRIGIARALYRNSDVLIMDEPTSALDSETEHAISGSINELHGELTIILIAHRLSTVKNCDRIFFLKAGQVVAADRFDRLVQNNADFRSMVQRMELGAEA